MAKRTPRAGLPAPMGKQSESLVLASNAPPPSVRAAALVAIVATLTTLLTLSPDGWGPGTTCDEYFYAAAGKKLVNALSQQGLGFFQPEAIEANYGGIALHPPLGRWLLGLAQLPFDPWPHRPELVWLPAARIAPALVFGGLVFLVGAWVSRRHGARAGVTTAVAAALTPRLFGHAHLAALDLFTAAFSMGAIVSADVAARAGAIDSWRRAAGWAGSGFVLGLAMLTRINGFLLVPPIALWLVWRFRWQAIAAGAVWLLVGLATFFVGWPWLWIAPRQRFVEFMSSGTVRQSIHVFYLGQVWQDRDVPWHYAWVILLATVPAGILLLAAAVVWLQPRKLMSDSLGSLVAINLLFLLLVFSLPGVPVYDGERLFLLAVPLVAVLAGLGMEALLDSPALLRIAPQRRTIMAGGFLLLQGAGILAYHPFELSHYNLLVGGLPGAASLGLETTYWGDSINAPLLRVTAEAAPGESVLFAPNLAPFQAPSVEAASTTLRASRTTIVGWDPNVPETAARCRYLLVYRRRADLETIEPWMGRGTIVAEGKRQGVWLSRLYRLDQPLPEARPTGGP